MAYAPFGFGRLWPVAPTALEDEATPAGHAPGQMPVDPRRDGSVQPTAAGRQLSGAIGGIAGGVAQGLLDAAKLPGDVYAGRIDPMSEQGIGRAFDLAGSLVTGGMPMAEAGAAGIFGGRLAKTADQGALKRAEGMAAGGADRQAIWDETGWFQGADKKWRFEIPDDLAHLETPRHAPPGYEALQHPDLQDAYPAMWDRTQQSISPDPKRSGSYHREHDTIIARGPTEEARRSVALHELQHAVQNAEGFTPGSNPVQFTRDGYANALLNRWTDGGSPAISEVTPGAFEKWQWDQYKRTAGETEARNVMARRNMTLDQRRETPPWETQDVPDAQQIIHGAPGTGAQLSLSAPGPIRAFHGSPHDFDRFDVSRIGTGEGNQGFGRGLYFAGDERIARSYRDDLSRVPVLKFDGDTAGLNLTSPQNARDLAAFGFSTANGHLDAGLNNIRMMADFDPRLAPFAEEAAQHLRDGRVAMGPKSPGHMYEVAIDADPARLLDWDTPLAGQSPAVRSFAGDRMADPQARAAIETAARQRLGGPPEVTGHDLYRGLTGYDDAAKAATSADMQAAGIPGVQYLDTGSRGFGGGSQTRQYVTFGDDLVSVVRKYATPGAVGAGGAAAALAPGDAQAAPSPTGAPMAAGPRPFSFMPVVDDYGRPLPGMLPSADGPETAPRASVAAQPQPSAQQPPAPFGFGVPQGFGPGSAGANLPLPPQEPAATGAVAPASRPAPVAAPAPPPSRGLSSAPLPPERPAELGPRASDPPAAPSAVPQTAAAPGPSAWDRVSQFLGGNSDMLIGIGTGLMSTPGLGRGLAAGVQNGVAMQNASAAQGLARAKQAVEMQKYQQAQRGITANAGIVKQAFPWMTDEQATARAADSANVTEALKILRDPSHGRENDPAVVRARAQAHAEGAAAGKPEADEAGKLKAAMEARRAAAPGLGLVEGSPAWQSFVGTGKIGRDQDLSATDKQAIQEADDNVMAAQGAINSMRQARELSKKAYDGPTAGIRGTVTSLFGSEAGEATKALDNVVTTNSLAQLKAIFGGNPTEGERKILLDVQGAANQPQAVRDGIFERAAAMAERRLEYNQRRAEELRGGTYYKKGSGAPVAPQGDTQPPASTAAPAAQGGAPDPLAAARAAISQGADRKAVIQRLLQNKIDPRGL